VKKVFLMLLFLFVNISFQPSRFEGGTGSPLNAIALF
jgi:hypothetical protein